MDRKGYWAKSLVRAVREAQEAGKVKADVDPEQLGWELLCLLAGANDGHLGGADGQSFSRARRAIRERLERAAAS